MNKKSFICSVTGLLTIGALTGLLLTNRTEAQSTHPDPNHHSAPKAPQSQGGMMAYSDQRFIEMMIPHHQDWAYGNDPGN
jgi:uncharacterized protein (DUF305 family)